MFQPTRSSPNPNCKQVGGRVALPSPEQLVVLVCSRGPKSLVALDWLAEACPRAVCVDGGITAWDVAKLPTESTSAVPPPQLEGLK
jgi:rhodanese-related sulfurtransferase